MATLSAQLKLRFVVHTLDVFTAAEVLIFAWAELEGATAVPGERRMFRNSVLLCPHPPQITLRASRVVVVRLNLRSFCFRDASLFYPFQHGGEKNLLKCAWAPDGEMVSAGSSDQAVHIWDEPSTQELYFLPGHTGSVNEVSKGDVADTSLSCMPYMTCPPFEACDESQPL